MLEVSSIWVYTLESKHLETRQNPGTLDEHFETKDHRIHKSDRTKTLRNPDYFTTFFFYHKKTLSNRRDTPTFFPKTK